jgi:hypothetical protein
VAAALSFPPDRPDGAPRRRIPRSGLCNVTGAGARGNPTAETFPAMFWTANGRRNVVSLRVVSSRIFRMARKVAARNINWVSNAIASFSE